MGQERKEEPGISKCWQTWWQKEHDGNEETGFKLKTMITKQGKRGMNAVTKAGGNTSENTYSTKYLSAGQFRSSKERHWLAKTRKVI